MKKVFVWDPVRKEYSLGSYKKNDSNIDFEEIQQVFESIKPYAQQVLGGKIFNLRKAANSKQRFDWLVYIQIAIIIICVTLLVLYILHQ